MYVYIYSFLFHICALITLAYAIECFICVMKEMKKNNSEHLPFYSMLQFMVYLVNSADS